MSKTSIAKRASVRNFQITPTQYQLFKFTVVRPTRLYIRMMATSPVNLVLLDSDQRAEYENGQEDTHPYTTAWGRRSDLEEEVDVDSGTWYLVVEGGTEPSKGRVEVYQ
jgi:hypothetical protein